VETESWGSLLASGRLSHRPLLLDLFHQMAEILTVLHAYGHFIPHLILNDIMAVPGEGDTLSIKIDYKLSRFIDPKLDRPAPMLKKLLICHPDIVGQRPLISGAISGHWGRCLWSFSRVIWKSKILRPR